MENNFYYDFLDNLRGSGVINMFGSASYLMEAFPELSKEGAKEVLHDWMYSSNSRKSSKQGEA